MIRKLLLLVGFFITMILINFFKNHYMIKELDIDINNHEIYSFDSEYLYIKNINSNETNVYSIFDLSGKQIVPWDDYYYERRNKYFFKSITTNSSSKFFDLKGNHWNQLDNFSFFTDFKNNQAVFQKNNFSPIVLVNYNGEIIKNLLDSEYKIYIDQYGNHPFFNQNLLALTKANSKDGYIDKMFNIKNSTFSENNYIKILNYLNNYYLALENNGKAYITNLYLKKISNKIDTLLYPTNNKNYLIDDNNLIINLKLPKNKIILTEKIIGITKFDNLALIKNSENTYFIFDIKKNKKFKLPEGTYYVYENYILDDNKIYIWQKERLHFIANYDDIVSINFFYSNNKNNLVYKYNGKYYILINSK